MALANQSTNNVATYSHRTAYKTEEKTSRNERLLPFSDYSLPTILCTDLALYLTKRERREGGRERDREREGSKQKDRQRQAKRETERERDREKRGRGEKKERERDKQKDKSRCVKRWIYVGGEKVLNLGANQAVGRRSYF